jgi:hypothetical protein
LRRAGGQRNARDRLRARRYRERLGFSRFSRECSANTRVANN